MRFHGILGSFRCHGLWWLGIFCHFCRYGLATRSFITVKLKNMKPLETHGILQVNPTSYPKPTPPGCSIPTPAHWDEQSCAYWRQSIGMDWWQVLKCLGWTRTAYHRWQWRALPSLPHQTTLSNQNRSNFIFNSLNLIEFDNQQAVKNSGGKNLSACLKPMWRRRFWNWTS